MIRHIITIIVAIALCYSTVWADEGKSAITQKDFVRLMFQQFSWEDGLAKEPTDRDFLLILNGKRKFSFEAENAYNENTDRVSVREFALYGPYTGKGWLMGVSDTTTANFTLLVPLRGSYTLKAVVKGTGFIWNVDNKNYRADSSSDKFREVEIGKISLKAGVLKIQVSVPPEGAIDSFSFSATDHRPIQPVDGWRFKEALTAGRMAEIAVSITGSLDQLPETQQNPPKQLAVYEIATIPPTATKTDASEFGKFNAHEWVRADYRGAAIQIPLKITDAGFYEIAANAMGGVVTGSVNEAQFDTSAKPYLENVRLGLYRLESGDNLITINLPPMGGIDTLELRKKSMAPDDFLRLSGIKGPPERLIPPDEANSVLKSIQARYSIRK